MAVTRRAGSPGTVSTLEQDIERLGATANRIADERNALLEVVKAEDAETWEVEVFVEVFHG